MTDIKVTDAAVSRLKELIQNKPEALGVRLTIMSGGCAGYKFSFDYLTETKEDDTILEYDNLKVAVDNLSCSMITGLELDYIQDNFGTKFVFNNTKNQCGCGKSFGV